MFTILTALAMAAAADPGASTEDKTVHSCPAEWEIGSEDGWEIGTVCEDKDGQTWKWDGERWVPDAHTWDYPDPYRADA